MRLDLEVTGSDDDNVAPYATAQMALSQEAIMLGIVSELRQRSSKFILIRATDSLDELFLARYLRKEYSQARLVIPTPDLLFAREEGGLLDGVLALNTYPVLPAYLNQLCSPPASAGPLIFPTAASAGLYNATTSMLKGLFKPMAPSARSRAASGTFKDQFESTTTNESGIAESAAITANSTPGGYGAVAKVPGSSSTATFSLGNTDAIITATKGSSQSTVLGTIFDSTLQATVTNRDGKPLPGLSVKFQIPASGASATFAGGVYTAQTNADGVAESPALTANSIAGSYSIGVIVEGVEAGAPFSLANTNGEGITIAIGGGTPQTAIVGTNFNSTLKATVRYPNGKPVVGAPVTFEIIPSAPIVMPLDAAMNPCQLSPNLWLTIVSRNTIYPLKVLRRPKGSLFFRNATLEGQDEQVRRSGRITGSWAFSFLLCVALVGFHLSQSWKGGSLGEWQTARQIQDGGKGLEAKAWILWGGAVALFGLLAVFSFSIELPTINESWTRYLAIFVWTLLTLFTLFVSVDFLLRKKETFLGSLFVALWVCILFSRAAYAYWGPGEVVLGQQRALDLASRISPTTPLVLLLAAFYIWFWYSLRSETLTDWRRLRLPNEGDLPETYDRLTEGSAECIRKLIHPFAAPSWVLWGAIGIVFCFALPGLTIGPGHLPLRSLEGWIFDFTYSLLFGIALVLLIATLLRIIALWREFRLMLTALDRPGMGQALAQLKGFEWDDIWNPVWSMQNETRRLISKEVQVVERLLQSLEDSKSTHPTILEVRKHINDILALRLHLIRISPSKCPARPPKVADLRKRFEEMQEELALTAGILCKNFLDRAWRSLPADSGTPSQEKTQDSGVLLVKLVNTEIPILPPTDPPQLSDKFLQLAEEFVACVYANFITTVLLRIRWLVFSSVLIYTAVVFSSVSYPFEPAPSLSGIALLLFLLGGIVIGYVYEEMHRDVTLRRLTSTDPNKVDSAFWFKLVSAGLLPLLGLLTSLFPQVGHVLYTIVAPILQASR